MTGVRRLHDVGRSRGRRRQRADFATRVNGETEGKVNFRNVDVELLMQVQFPVPPRRAAELGGRVEP